MSVDNCFDIFIDNLVKTSPLSLEELKNPKSVLAYSVYFDKDKEFVNYMITLLGKEVSFYDKEFREKNLDLLNKIKTEL